MRHDIAPGRENRRPSSRPVRTVPRVGAEHRFRWTPVAGNCHPCSHGGMFAFFSNRLGCLGSLLVSLVGTAVLLLLLYSCQRL